MVVLPPSKFTAAHCANTTAIDVAKLNITCNGIGVCLMCVQVSLEEGWC